MNNLFKQYDFYGTKSKTVTIQDAIVGLIEEQYNCNEENIEIMDRKIDMLAKILAEVVETLPKEAQLTLLNNVSFNWSTK